LRTAHRFAVPKSHRIEISGEGEAAIRRDTLFHYRSEPIQILQIHNLARLALLLFITAAIVVTAQHVDVRNPYANGVIQIAHTAIDRTTFAFRNAVSRVAPQVVAPPEPSAFEQEQQMSAGELMDRWSPVVQQASERFSIPAAWIRAVMQAESGGRTMLGEDQPIASGAGAVGLMQLMPATYDQMRVQNGLGVSALNPRDNIMAGAAYLRWLYQKYGYPKMFAAYNAGPAKLQNHLTTGQSLPVETRNYVTRIAHTLGTVFAFVKEKPKSNGKVHLAAKSGSRTHLAGNHRALVKFTRPNGRAVWIDVKQIASVRPALHGEYPRSVRSIITAGRTKQAVRESVAIVKAAKRRLA
jgi:hypothetical protein